MCDVWHCGPLVMQPRSQGLSSCGDVARAEEPGLTPGGAVCCFFFLLFFFCFSLCFLILLF